MDELQKCAQSGASTLDGLAMRARLLTQSIALNSLELGRVLAEAKPLVKHGAWGKWLQENAPIGERGAQYLIAVYKRFGENPNLAQIDSSKLVKMLALPVGAEDEFAREHDLQGMTAREVEGAIREKVGKAAAPSRDPPPERIPDDVLDQLRKQGTEINAYKAEIQRIGESAKDIAERLRIAGEEKVRLERENRMQAQMLEAAQTSVREAQGKLLREQSQRARGEVEPRTTDRLTPDAFAAAVRQFMGMVQAMPHMGRAFSTMSGDELAAFDANLRVIEGWATGTRAALNTIAGEVVEA